MITREEYKFLKKIKTEGSKWIARDKNWKLYRYSEMPRRCGMIWNFGGLPVNIREEHFTFIKWEDEEPTRITDLINEYESHKEVVGEREKVEIPQFIARWIEEVKALERPFALEYLFDTNKIPDDVYNLLDELLDWFVVEKEKLYTVRLANGDFLCRFKSVGIDWAKGQDYRNDPDFQLTQSEIESVDPRLMEFAEEVVSG